MYNCILSFQSHVHNFDIFIGFVSFWVYLHLTDFLAHVHPLDNPAENGVFVVQPWLFVGVCGCACVSIEYLKKQLVIVPVRISTTCMYSMQ